MPNFNARPTMIVPIRLEKVKLTYAKRVQTFCPKMPNVLFASIVLCTHLQGEIDAHGVSLLHLATFHGEAADSALNS